MREARAKLAALHALRDSAAYQEVFLSASGVHQEGMREAEAFFLQWSPTAEPERLQLLSAQVLAWQFAKKGLTWLDDQIQDLERQLREVEDAAKDAPPPVQS